MIKLSLSVAISIAITICNLVNTNIPDSIMSINILKMDALADSEFDEEGGKCSTMMYFNSFYDGNCDHINTGAFQCYPGTLKSCQTGSWMSVEHICTPWYVEVLYDNVQRITSNCI